MSKTIYTHISGSDALPLEVMRVTPDDTQDIRGIVQLVHGKNEHKELYEEFMRYLSSYGYVTVIHDNRGHGNSVLRPADRGYMYEGGMNAFIEDIYEISCDIKEWCENEYGRDLPMTLLGHSMGSMAIRCYIREHDTMIDRLGVIGSPSKSRLAPIGLMLVRGYSRLRGGRVRSKLVDFFIMRMKYARLDRKEKMHGSWTNTNTEAVKKRQQDEKCRFKFTLSGFECMTGLSILTYKGGYTAKNPDLKIRFFSGYDDPCMGSVQKQKQSMAFLRRRGYKNISGKVYHGMRHDILNERRKDKVYKDILKFIEE